MCTVTYIPMMGNKNFLLTSNRDEAPGRAALAIKKQRINDVEVLFPEDPHAHGSWIGASQNGRVVCLLNGAFDFHQRNPPYRMSRGLVVLDALSSSSIDDFILEYSLENIEPFTLVICAHDLLLELRWDGIKKHVLQLDNSKRHIWASSTLYTNEWRAMRRDWFKEWSTAHPAPSKKEIMAFHGDKSKGDLSNGLIMNREDKVKTISITCVEGNLEETTIDFEHVDLIKEHTEFGQLEIR